MDHSYKTKVICNFELGENVLLEIKPYLEVSFPCSNCKRDHRTVIFRNIGSRGICTPKGKCLGFPGIMSSLSIIGGEQSKAEFLIEYNYSSFVDAKYKRPTKLGATWARVNYAMTCPKCMEQFEGSTQTNLGRPIQKKCSCGFVLNSENDNPFKFENT